MLTVCRERFGRKDAELVRELAARTSVVNFDEERYIFPEWQSDRLLWLARRILRPAAVGLFNREMRRTADDIGDHDLFVVKGTSVEPETVTSLKSRGGRVVYYLPDLSIASDGDRLRLSLLQADEVLTTKLTFTDDFPEVAARTKVTAVLPFYPTWLEQLPISRDIRRDALGFLGNFSSGKASFIRKVARLGIGTIELIGYGWEPLRDSPGVRVLGPLFGPTAFLVAQTWLFSMGLLMESHQGARSSDEVTMRSFAEPAAGVNTIHMRTAQFVRLLPEFPTMERPEDLVDIARDLRARPTEELRKAREDRRRAVRALHTSSADMADRLFGLFSPHAIERA